jgi:hypothetical protein
MDTGDIVSTLVEGMKPDMKAWKAAESAEEIVKVLQDKDMKRTINLIKKNLNGGYSFLPPKTEQYLKRFIVNTIGMHNISFYGGWYACIAAYLISPAYKEIASLQKQKVKGKPNQTINQQIKHLVRESIIWTLKTLNVSYYEDRITIMLNVKHRSRDISEYNLNQIMRSLEDIKVKMDNLKNFIISNGINLKGSYKNIAKFLSKLDDVYSKVATRYGWSIHPNILPNQRIDEIADKIMEDDEPKLE